jgi:colanic acid/amylovoran biosynthesis glycosyltransferase
MAAELIGLDVAYVLHRFPCLTETFVAEEIRNMQSLGVKVRLFSLLPPTKELVHPVSADLVPQVRYAPQIYGLSLWWAQLHFLFRSPRQYARLLWSLMAEPSPEFNFIWKRLVIFLKGVWVARQLEGSPTQLVHTHFAWLSAAACMVIGKLLDLPLTITAHAYDIYSHKSDLLALTTRAADRVVTISDHNKEAILDRSAGLDPQRIQVLHCGIDLDHFQRPGGRPANQVFQITAVGSLIEKKGHEYLIRACREAKAQGLSFECMIVGEGELEQRLQTLIQDLGLDGRVILAGGQTQTWVRDRLGMSDLFALACVIGRKGERDGIPVAMMEALAMEVPVVSTPVSGIPELIRHEETGLLVPPKDAIALAEAIARLTQDEPLRQKLAKNGRAVVEREYDIRKNASRLAELFQQVIEERRE